MPQRTQAPCKANLSSISSRDSQEHCDKWQMTTGSPSFLTSRLPLGIPTSPASSSTYHDRTALKTLQHFSFWHASGRQSCEKGKASSEGGAETLPASQKSFILILCRSWHQGSHCPGCFQPIIVRRESWTKATVAEAGFSVQFRVKQTHMITFVRRGAQLCTRGSP